MSEGEIDPEDLEEEDVYVFEIQPLTDNISELRSLEYLENYILQAELQMVDHVEDELANGQNISEYYYETVIGFISSNKIGNSDQISFFKTVYEDTIFGFKTHLNEELLICGLRFLYIFSNYFNVIDEVDRDELIKKLINLVISQEEPIPTYAIKCLQMPILTLKQATKIELLKQLSETLIERISTILEFNAHDILIPVSGLEYLKCERKNLSLDPLASGVSSKNMDELGFKFSNMLSYVDGGINNIGPSQIFHHVALLQYLIPNLEMSELLENPLFFDLLYTCLNTTICKTVNVIIIVLMIIYNFIENEDFMIRFLSTRGISRMCVIPYHLISSMYISWILDNISEKCLYVKFLFKNYIGEFELAIKYCINSLSFPSGCLMCNFILNLFVYPKFYKIFIRVKGIKLIFETMKKNPIFDDIKVNDYTIGQICGAYRYMENKIKNFLKILLTHIFIQISDMTPTRIINSIPFIRYNKINYDINDILIDYFGSVGGFKMNIDFYEELLEVDAFEVIVSILRMTCRSDIFNSNMKIYKNVMYCIKFLSLYYKSKSIFIHPFDPYLRQLKQGNDLIVLFRSLANENIHRNCLNQSEIIPFDIYHNLLVSCFSDFKTYKKVIKLENEKKLNAHVTEKNAFNKESILFMDRLVQTGFIYQILTVLPDMELALRNKIYAIKCLLILLTNKNVIQMVSVMQKTFIPQFEFSLITIANSKNTDTKIRSFLTYSFRLIYKLNRYGYFKFIDHIAFQDFFLSERNKVEQSFNARYSLPNSIKTNNQQQLEDSQIFKEVFAIQTIEKSENQKLNSYLDLIPHIYPINKLYLQHSKKSEKLISSNNVAFEKHYKCNMNLSLNKVKLNSYKSIYNQFNKVSYYADKSSSSTIYNVKQLIDDSIIIASNNGIYHFPCDKEKSILSTHKISHIDDSYNGEFIVGCGINDRPRSLFTEIWKYDPTKCRHSAVHKNYYEDLNCSKLTHDNLNIFGINGDNNALIIDIETSKIVSKYFNEKRASLPRMNFPAINYRDHLLLFNGGLFCIRSDKFIHSFSEFDQHISGNFVHLDTKALINCELWDLRTLKLYDVEPEFKNFFVRKTHNDYILMGIKLQDYYRIKSSEDQSWYWESFTTPYQNILAIYDANTFSKIGKFQNLSKLNGELIFKRNIKFANISRDCTKITVGFKNYDYNQHKFELLEIGNKEARKIEIDCSTQSLE